ncbi:hypothetical protein FT663_02863 [Candidozyma haemuli var. vulneris]|nr:hypothetical protein FT662_02751 [[Candida] haemuloni var. vulneris]KAF3991136.1 hypothetical protein FT663_02863 [[Candida] haemuloni var. vulneris]
MGYTIKQKIEICLQSEANPHMTQSELASWAKEKYGSSKPPSQTTISRILSSKSEILGSKESDFALVRRRKQSNPLLRKILTEWITQALWESIPITTPIIQSTANAIWTRLRADSKDGNGVFNHKWCNHFVKKLNINLEGSPQAIQENLGKKLDNVWRLDEKLELKQFIKDLVSHHNYSPKDLFTVDEFQLFHALPLDQIFDISSIDKGLKQSGTSSENMLTIMLGCNIDGSEKLTPLVVSRQDKFDVSASSHAALRSHSGSLTTQTLMNKLDEVYQISYRSNNNKWITSSMFQDYLLTLDHKIENSTPERQIVIFLDNSSSHRIINLEFKHIRLVYMENASKHRNPYGGSFNGVKFDYLPMSFGIVEEFKILYRLQQYLDMINKQRSNSGKDSRSSSLASPVSLDSFKTPSVMSESAEVLAESDYQVPFIKVIEWIKRAWDSISAEKIFLSWRSTYLMNFKQPWPASDPKIVEDASTALSPFANVLKEYNASKSYDKLREIMKYLNVVIPWEIDELLGLVNERSKVSLNYVSIEEIIGSCVAASQDDPEEQEMANGDTTHTPLAAGWFNEETSAQLADTSFPAESASPMTTQAKLPDSNMNMSPSPFNSAAVGRGPMMYHANQVSQQYTPNNQMTNQSSTRQEQYGQDYSGGSPSTMSALLLATNVARPPDQAFSPLPLPKGEISLPPVSRMDMGGYQGPFERKHRLNSVELEPLHPDRKRQNYNQPMASPLYGNGLPPSTPYYPSLPEQIPNEGISHIRRPNEPRLPSVGRRFRENIREGTNNGELIGLLNKVISASKNDGITLSEHALEEIRENLSKMQHKQEHDGELRN